MDSEEAFFAIRKAFQSDRKVTLVKSVYDDENFGNFAISFRRAGRPYYLVLDRSELAICKDRGGDDDCKTILSFIYDMDEKTVLAAVADALSAHSNSTMI